MILILVAFLLVIAACVIAWRLAIHALPVMVAISVAQLVWDAGAGVFLSGLAACAAALLSIALVVGVLGYVENPVLRLLALALFAVPAVTAGYALVHGVAKHAIESAFMLNLFGGVGGLVVGIAAIANLNALGGSRLSR